MSFLPYCTVCDKQVSANSLYCSKECKRKDARANRKIDVSYISSSLPSASAYSVPSPLSPHHPDYSSAELTSTYASSVPYPSYISTSPSSKTGDSSHSDLSQSYSFVSAAFISKGFRQRHPNSVYSSSPRSIDLVSPFQRTPSIPKSPGNDSTPRNRAGLVEPSYNVPLIVEKKSLQGIDAHQTEGSLKKLFYFSEVPN
ncbi:hypothetical protein V1512DRAFT_256973 [Lipomyces arxii]|uniref:uncharacterized protein n=1 Tax=Lipomyces arxii TaxID=56418 RepID=UPI0034CDF484